MEIARQIGGAAVTTLERGSGTFDKGGGKPIKPIRQAKAQHVPP